ncbi:MAG TPA: glycosyltransferase family 2 protein [Stellaceae bacterium]|nr:glycosyltransferase family 2 protein [Stellaceae bacterium]
MDLSVVIPARNEAPSVASLVAEIRRALDGRIDYEIVYVDDGSLDGTAEEVRRVAQELPTLRLVRHQASCGQSMAILTGIKAARAAWIATLDADGQNDPADIPRLWDIARAAPALQPLMVAGERQKRRDTWSKRSASRAANAIRQSLLGDGTPDTGCGLKLFQRDFFLELPRFDHMHRFLPALTLRAGGKVVSVPVNHRPRESGRSNYGVFDRLWAGIIDLMGVMWLMRRAKNPVVLEEPPQA